MSGGLTIIVNGPGQLTARYSLKDGELSIGRATSNDIVLRDLNVSRRHARLIARGGRYLLLDIVSTNGTYLNGRRLEVPTDIAAADRVHIGGYMLEIESDGEPTQERPLPPFVPRDATEAALLRAIGHGGDGGDGGDANRQVYGDWLEEHGHMREAEFIRLQQTLVAMAPEAPEFASHSKRLHELATALDFRWRVRVARPAIEQCAGVPAFDFRCPKDWGSLAPTSREDVRHCGACKRYVYYCTNVPEARGHAARGECVALDLRAMRWRDDVQPPYGIRYCPACGADVGRPSGSDCPRCGESLRIQVMMGAIA